jgi:hypothetical protein
MMKKEQTAHEFPLTQGDSDTKATSKGETTIRARVFRAATGQWEDLGVIYTDKGKPKEA